MGRKDKHSRHIPDRRRSVPSPEVVPSGRIGGATVVIGSSTNGDEQFYVSASKTHPV